jgi:hypothetical protein
MEFNSSLNRFGNLRNNQYRELVNDEFNDARSQVIARQFTQSKQFLETYEREKVGDRLINLEVAKTITALNNAIIKSTNDIDNNQPNSEEGVIVAYRVATDMLNAYINASGTKTRDTERYRNMIYGAIPALNTYYEKASQVDKIDIIKPQQLQIVADIIERLESGYSQGQNYNGKNLASNAVVTSLDAEVIELYKNLVKNYDLLIQVYQDNKNVVDRYQGENRQIQDWKEWIDIVQKKKELVDQLSSYIVNGKVDYKNVVKLFNIPLLPLGGKTSRAITVNRESVLKQVIEKLRSEYNSVRRLLMVANDPNSPFNMFQRTGSLDSRPVSDQSDLSPAGIYTPTQPPAPPTAQPQSASRSVESLKNNFVVFWEKIYRGEKQLSKTNDATEVHKINEELRIDRNEADSIEEELKRTHGVKTGEFEALKLKAKTAVGSGRRRKRGGVKRTARSSQPQVPSMTKDAIKFEEKQVKALQRKPFMEEPSLKFPDINPHYRQVDFHLEGAGKTKSRRSRSIILFDRI